MNTGRLVGAILAVWIVRVIINALVYGVAFASQMADMSAAHPGMFREVIPGFIAADLIFAAVFVYLFARVGKSLGTGIGAGVTLGVLVALLAAFLPNLYMFFGVTYMSPGMMVTDSVIQIIAHAIEGAVAAAIYKA